MKLKIPRRSYLGTLLSTASNSPSTRSCKTSDKWVLEFC
jgi:hypothetical protein